MPEGTGEGRQARAVNTRPAETTLLLSSVTGIADADGVMQPVPLARIESGSS